MKNTKKHKRVVQLQTNVMRKHGLKHQNENHNFI